MRLLFKPLFVLALMAFAVSASTLAAPPFSEAASMAIDRAAQEQVRSGRTTGLAIEVVQDGKTVFTRGYGKANLELDVPVTPDTVFRIASITKTFTAASVLLLVERGKLSLDDKLSRYLPDFPRADEVTIRHLLTHTSGLASYTRVYPRKEEFLAVRSMPEMVAIIQQLEPLYRFSPGTQYHYSNSGYYLLGAILEKVSGKDLGTFMQENIFSKTGMQHTAMDRAEDIVPHRASGYTPVKDKPGVFVNAKFYPYTYPGPAGGLRSTVGDLAKFHVALVNGKIVGPEMLAQMLTPARVKDGRLTSEATWSEPDKPAPKDSPAGFGIGIGEWQGHKMVIHSGGILGFSSVLYSFPDDGVTISILTNSDAGVPGELREAVNRAVLGADVAKPKN